MTPWSSTYESDGLNRLKGLKFGTMSGGTISGGNIVQQEDWQTGGTLKLDQVGNWVDYKRTRESAAQDDWVANTFTGINAYSKIDRVSGADWEPEYTAKGLAKKDDKTGGTTKGYQYTFDAWDRLVTVKSNSGAVVEEFRYNGLGHRIGWHYDVDADLDVDGDDRWFSFQYNERWQQVAMYYHTNSSPREVFTYLAAGRDGYGGSSYIDDCLMRERDTNADGDLDERLYYLQNWRHDVVALMTYDGAIKERLTYDAYGRPHAFSPGDLITKISGTPYDRPSGTLDADDTWTTGSVVWNKDIGNGSGVAIPDGAVTSADGTTLTNLKAAGYSAGYGILSDSTIANRKGYAGYEFDTILEGAASTDNKPVYHVRHRVLAADTGKWFQKDPLGYHDSMDLYEYCQSDAIDAADSEGRAINVTTPTRLRKKCGGLEVHFDFTLDRDAPCDGYFVQHISKVGSYSNCSGGPRVPYPAATEFWEAWFVPKGMRRWDPNQSLFEPFRRIPGGRPDPGPRQPVPLPDGSDIGQITDVEKRSAVPDTRKGYGVSFGIIKFFCKKDLVRHGSDPRSWTDGHRDSGNLLSTTTRPSWWDGPSEDGPADRGVQWEWENCCNGLEETTTVREFPQCSIP